MSEWTSAQIISLLNKDSSYDQAWYIHISLPRSDLFNIQWPKVINAHIDERSLFRGYTCSWQFSHQLVSMRSISPLTTEHLPITCLTLANPLNTQYLVQTELQVIPAPEWSTRRWYYTIINVENHRMPHIINDGSVPKSAPSARNSIYQNGVQCVECTILTTFTQWPSPHIVNFVWKYISLHQQGYFPFGLP